MKRVTIGQYLITETEIGIRISDISGDGVMVVRPQSDSSVEIFDKWHPKKKRKSEVITLSKDQKAV